MNIRDEVRRLRAALDEPVEELKSPTYWADRMLHYVGMAAWGSSSNPKSDWTLEQVRMVAEMSRELVRSYDLGDQAGRTEYDAWQREHPWPTILHNHALYHWTYMRPRRERIIPTDSDFPELLAATKAKLNTTGIYDDPNDLLALARELAAACCVVESDPQYAGWTCLSHHSAQRSCAGCVPMPPFDDNGEVK